VLRGSAPVLVLSHAPPRDAGDTPTDAYHVGLAAYRFLAHRLRPPLWLHGHTNPAAQEHWRVDIGQTTYVNVTGSVLVELLPPAGG
jgi:Icc-related predicted phosphoesterase